MWHRWPREASSESRQSKVPDRGITSSEIRVKASLRGVACISSAQERPQCVRLGGLQFPVSMFGAISCQGFRQEQQGCIMRRGRRHVGEWHRVVQWG